VVVPLPPSKSQTKPKNPMFYILSVIITHCKMFFILSAILNHCRISTFPLNKTCNSTGSTYPGTPNSLFNNEFVYRRGYPVGGQCTAESDSSSDPVTTCCNQEDNLTVNKSFFRKFIKGTSHPLCHLPSLLHRVGTSEGDQPGFGPHNTTVRIISTVVIIHRRG
jgi:hypothetical protein